MYIKTDIFSCFNGESIAYIYIWISKKHKIVYVGMTNSYTGTIGRAGGHFSHTGTLRKRFLQNRGYHVNMVDDFVLLSFPLPSKRKFITLEKSYREAVEYLVQKELLVIRGQFNPSFDVISWVRYNPRVSEYEIIKLSQKIIDDFKIAFSSI